MNNWLENLQRLVADGESAILVTVAGTRGSTPREMGAKMIVTATATIGTIGGGQLEFLCTKEACRLLATADSSSGSNKLVLRSFTLGANCGQCCGGVAEILFEEISEASANWIGHLTGFREAGIDAAMVTARQSRISTVKMLVTMDDWFSYGDDLVPDPAVIEAARQTIRSKSGVNRNAAKIASNVELPVLIEAVRENDFRVVIFGAGHVGSACAAVLSLLGVKVDLVDSRAGIVDGPLPSNVELHEWAEPAHFATAVPSDRFFLVMTHDHGMDFDICAQILRRDDVVFCGLIGSISKRRRFEKRFRALGLTETQIGQLTCPIGIDEISGKKPAEIAVAVAAQLQALYESGVRASDVSYTNHAALGQAERVTGG